MCTGKVVVPRRTLLSPVKSGRTAARVDPRGFERHLGNADAIRDPAAPERSGGGSTGLPDVLVEGNSPPGRTGGPVWQLLWLDFFAGPSSAAVWIARASRWAQRRASKSSKTFLLPTLHLTSRSFPLHLLRLRVAHPQLDWKCSSLAVITGPRPLPGSEGPPTLCQPQVSAQSPWRGMWRL